MPRLRRRIGRIVLNTLTGVSLATFAIASVMWPRSVVRQDLLVVHDRLRGGRVWSGSIMSVPHCLKIEVNRIRIDDRGRATFLTRVRPSAVARGASFQSDHYDPIDRTYYAEVAGLGGFHATHEAADASTLAALKWAPPEELLLLSSFRQDWWEVQVPWWVIAVASAILPGARYVGWMRARRAVAAGLCPRCRYDLTGNVSGVCPECGTPVSPAAPGERMGKPAREGGEVPEGRKGT